MSWFRTNRQAVHHAKARPGVPPASAALTSSLPPPFLLPLVAVSTFSITLLHLEKSRRIASIHMQNCHHWRRCGGACAGVMLHSVAVEVLAASLRETVVLQQRRSQELCEYPLECFKIVDIFLQDPKNNASIDL
jgi:hypothetical protein